MSRYRVVRGLLIGLAILAGLVMATSLSVLAYGGGRLRAASARFEREVGPLNLLGFARPRIPDERNAVTWLRPGVLAMVLFGSDRSLVGTLASKTSSEWTPKDVTDFEPLAERNEPGRQILERARGLTESNWNIPYENGNAAKLPDLLAAMNAGKLVAAHGRLAMRRGDRATALTDAETLGALARSHQRESATIVLLIGAALERIQLGLVKELVTDPGIGPAELDRLDAALSDVDLGRAFQVASRGESAALVHDIVESDSFSKEMPRVVPRSLVIGLSKLAVAAALESRYPIVPSLVAPITSPITDPAEGYNSRSWWQRIAEGYNPNLRSTFARGTGTMSARQLARLAIVLRRDALASGSYPAAFTTPVDPLTGAPYALEPKAGGIELRSTTTPEILQSIYPIGPALNAQLYAWSLPPSGSRSSTRSR